MGTEEAFERILASRERISVDDAHVVLILQTTFEHSLQRCSHENVGISRLADLASGNSHRAGQVDASGQEQAAEEDDSRGIDRPDYFALVDRVDVVHLHTNVACGASSVEDGHFHVLSLMQGFVHLQQPDTKIGLRHLRQSRQSSLERSLIALQLVFELTSQRHVAQRRHKDGLRLCCGICSHSIGKLIDVAKQTSLEQCLFHLVARERTDVLLAKFCILLLCIGFHLHTEHLASVATYHRRHLATHGRSKAHVGAVLVDKQGVASLDIVAFSHHHFRNKSSKVLGLQGIFLTHPDVYLLFHGSTLQLDV